MKRARVIAVATVVIAALSSAVGLGYASWVKAGSGAGSAAAKSLGAPTSVSGTAGDSSITVTVNAGPSSPSATGYVVKLGTSSKCTITGATGSCVASGLTNGTATTLSVLSTLNSWTSSASASVTATPAASNKVHIGAIALVSSANQNQNFWHASISVTVLDQNNNPVSGATVSGGWSPTTGANGNCSGGTTAAGTCTITTGNSDFPASATSETWSVAGVVLSGYTYDSASNSKNSLQVTKP